MSMWQRTSVRWIIILCVLVTILPSGRSQQRTRKPTPQQCRIPVEEFDNLVTLLEDIEREQSDESEETEDEPGQVSAQATSQCTRDLTRLRNSIRRLHESYQRLKDNSGVIDMREFQLRKNRYEQQKRDLQTRLGGLESRLSSVHRSQIVELKRKIRQLEQQVDKTVTELEQQRVRNAENYIRLVATKIDNAQYRNAYTNFVKLMAINNDPYADIVERVQRVPNMIKFLGGVDLEYKPIAGYEVLVDKLIQRQSLNRSNAVELLKHIQAILLARDGQQQSRAVALWQKFRMNAQ